MSLPASLWNKQNKSKPSIGVPIHFSEKLHEWYIQPDRLKRPYKFLIHFLGNLLAMLLLPLSMTIDLAVGIAAVVLIPLKRAQRVHFKQTAWDFIICGAFGPLAALFQMLKRMLNPRP
jgi:hypothetical protein